MPIRYWHPATQSTDRTVLYPADVHLERALRRRQSYCILHPGTALVKRARLNEHLHLFFDIS